MLIIRSGITRIASHPSYLFWSFAVAHLLLWTIIPTFVSPNAPLDVIEGYVWGHEWLWGTYKHPPMQAWWLETLTLLTGQAPWTHFLASQIAVVIAFWAVWQTGRRLVSERAALVGVLLLEGIVYYNFTSPEFNPNVLQLAFWALISLFFHRAVKDNRTVDWMLLGLWSACGLYSKYSTVLLLAVLGLLMVLHPESRRRLADKGPYIYVLVLFLLCVPHLIWLFDNDFLPIAYIKSRMHDAGAADEFVMRPLRVIVSQALVVLPTLLLLLPLSGRRIFTLAKIEQPLSFNRYFLNAVVFGPFLLLLLVALSGVRVHDMWATPLWGYAGLWLIDRLRPEILSNALHRFAYGWAATFILILTAYVGTTIFYPYATHSSLRVYFPGKALSKTVIGVWNQHYQEPLRYVIGDTWLAGNIAYYPPGRQHVLIDGNYKISPWIKPEDVEQQGAILVWCIENCACHNKGEVKPQFIQDFPQAQVQQPLVLRRQTSADVPPVKIGWAILPPSSRGAPAQQKR